MADARIDVEGWLSKSLTGAISIQQEQVRAYVARVRRAHPDATPSEIIADLEWKYLGIASSSGGSVGAVAALPVVGTGTALVLSLAETGFFLEATALFTLAVAEVHGVPTYDLERRRLILMTVLLGEEGVKLLTKAVPRTANYWGKQAVSAIPMESIRAANKVLGPRFITKYGTKQGVVVLGRAIPFGIGAVIGGTANAIFADQVMRATRRAYGAAPSTWPAGAEGLGDVAVAPPSGEDGSEVRRSASPTLPDAGDGLDELA